MSICHFCKNKYESYPIIINSNIENYILENKIKEIYYDQKNNIGICQECRKVEINDIIIWRLLLNIKLEIMIVIDDLESQGKDPIKFKKSLERIKAWESKLEQNPEIQAIIKANLEKKE